MATKMITSCRHHVAEEVRARRGRRFPRARRSEQGSEIQHRPVLDPGMGWPYRSIVIWMFA
jgi:hypothetical protein